MLTGRETDAITGHEPRDNSQPAGAITVSQQSQFTNRRIGAASTGSANAVFVL
jgi:hypothetical protein